MYFYKSESILPYFWKYTLFFISNNFISNARLKFIKNQASTKQRPEAELLLFEKLQYSSSTLPSKNNRTYSKKQAKEHACQHS